MLLTHADLRNRKRYISVRDTLDTLLNNDVLSIVNENDNLSSMVASAAQADSLIICSDIDGFYNANPQSDKSAKLIPDVYKIDVDVYKMAGGAISSVGAGGMKTKIQAAEKAVSHVSIPT